MRLGVFAVKRGCQAAMVALALAACATAPATTPLLRLHPAALERPLALQQQLTVQVAGRSDRIEVLLEADARSVRLALVSLGQTGARLEWDGRELTQTQAAWWPKAVSGERVLSDLQLVLWPAAAVRAALPAGWSLEANDKERVLRHGAETVVSISYPSASLTELVHGRDGYRIRIDSRPLEVAQ
jgi:hypothetical protein